MNEGFLFYIESQILCVICMIVLLKCNSHSIQGSLKYTAAIGWVTVVASVTDVLRVVFIKNVLLANLFSIVYFSSYGIIGYLWLRYCLSQFGKDAGKLKKLCLLPAITTTVLAVLSVKTGWIFCHFGETSVFRGSRYYLIFINYIYVAMVFAMAITASKNTKNKREGHEYLLTASFAIPIVLSTILNILLPWGLNTFTYAILLSLIMIYCNLQYKKMVTDNLTKLLNRYGMDAEIKEQLLQYKHDKNDSFYIIACDMDNFKTINDTWGHPEGDRALKLIADVLTTVTRRYDAEVFRIGGDEFVIITDTSESGLAEEICRDIETGLDNLDFRDDFDICMSMGVSLYDGSCTISELINNADKKLYQAKQNK